MFRNLNKGSVSGDQKTVGVVSQGQGRQVTDILDLEV